MVDAMKAAQAANAPIARRAKCGQELNKRASSGKPAARSPSRDSQVLPDLISPQGAGRYTNRVCLPTAIGSTQVCAGSQNDQNVSKKAGPHTWTGRKVRRA